MVHTSGKKQLMVEYRTFKEHKYTVAQVHFGNSKLLVVIILHLWSVWMKLNCIIVESFPKFPLNLKLDIGITFLNIFPHCFFTNQGIGCFI